MDEVNVYRLIVISGLLGFCIGTVIADILMKYHERIKKKSQIKNE